ncbi:MAG: hypothetical protein H6Q14_718 [Bacteroidetes bacterium]|jgi:hypothetical protein|nr:hypothetical protein [Bacteroidota bacterium]
MVSEPITMRQFNGGRPFCPLDTNLKYILHISSLRISGVSTTQRLSGSAFRWMEIQNPPV